MELQPSPLCRASSPHLTLCSNSIRRTRGRGGSARRASDRFPKFLDSGIIGLGASCPPRQHTCLRPFYSLFSSQVTRFALFLLHLICREIICVCFSVNAGGRCRHCWSFKLGPPQVFPLLDQGAAVVTKIHGYFPSVSGIEIEWRDENCYRATCGVLLLIPYKDGC